MAGRREIPPPLVDLSLRQQMDYCVAVPYSFRSPGIDTVYAER